ncbi:hypothetical protein [Piscibacillus salipiscarius]|uniref:Secreted protein n=1 Tax=Piscibacillus salipiscarius TaxID=299480 RepID=A0ABW5QB05_9BACI
MKRILLSVLLSFSILLITLSTDIIQNNSNYDKEDIKLANNEEPDPSGIADIIKWLKIGLL